MPSELDYLRRALESGRTSAGGPFTARCEELLSGLVGSKKALLTTSCTDALELAALLLDLQPGDEVVVPLYTFPSTANAFALRGARPVFADIRPDTLNLDETKLEGLLTSRTRAIVAVHYAGVACDMEAVMGIAERAGVPVVEDNAHGLFGSYRGRPLGSFGSLSAASFHESKNVSCGEGGALFINDSRFAERAQTLRDKGTDRRRYLRGEVEHYTWVDVGSSFGPSDLLAAVLLARLERLEAIQGFRRRLWEAYFEALAPWAEAAGARLPIVPEDCAAPYHMFHLLMPSGEARKALLEHLAVRGVAAASHFQPLHLSAMGRRFGAAPESCPQAKSAAERIVRLPFYNGLGAEEQSRIIAAVRAFRGTTGCTRLPAAIPRSRRTHRGAGLHEPVPA